MISYAQNFEDVMLNRVFRDRTDGFYVDVGAADPVNLSVTKWFYDTGWNGINVEPHREFFQKLQSERPRDINLHCGAGAVDGEAVLQEFSIKEWSSFAPDAAADPDGPSPVARRSVPVRTLNTILEQHARGRHVDFLKIDVEGWEKEVLRGIDLRRHRPTVILVEAVDRNTHAVNSDWEDILLGADYELVYFDGLNKFYAGTEQRDIQQHFAVPPNVFDDYKLSAHVEQQKQISALSWIATHSDGDRKAHLDQIHQLTDMIRMSEADRAARLEQIHVLTDQIHNLQDVLTETEADRAARLDGINRLTAMLKTAEADRSELDGQIQLLAGKLKDAEADHDAQVRAQALSHEIETLKGTLKDLEADRAARLEQVHQLTAWLKKCDSERAARLEQVHQLTAWLKECDSERAAQLSESQRLGGLLSQSEAGRRALVEQYQRVAHIGPLLVGLSPKKKIAPLPQDAPSYPNAPAEQPAGAPWSDRLHDLAGRNGSPARNDGRPSGHASPEPVSPLARSRQSLLARSFSNVGPEDCYFYHWVDLPDGSTIRGSWDLRANWRAYLGHTELAGRRVLELGPASGFLSLMMEKAGAEVVAFDLPASAAPDMLPIPGADNDLLREQTVSAIQRVKNSWWYLHRLFNSRNKVAYGDIYRLPPGLGRFDVSVFGAILLHLSDPFKAIQEVAAVTRGAIVITDLLNEKLQDTAFMEFDPNVHACGPMGWWLLSPGACARMLTVAGFPVLKICYHENRHYPDLNSGNFTTFRYFTLIGMRKEEDVRFSADARLEPLDIHRMTQAPIGR
jgi:FkbM family methyltransferase